MRRSEAASGAIAALLLMAAAAGPALAQAAPAQTTRATPTQTTQATPGFQFGGDGPIEIESDKLEVRDHDNIAIFTGNVQLVQGKLLLKTVKMTVYYKSSGGGAAADNTQVDHMEAEGKVYIKQGDQVATGDQGTYDMTTGIMVLTGKEVVLTQGDNVVVGCKLVSNSKSGQSRLDGCGKGAEGGRIKMLLQPGTQSN
jgi:lipopolysaccharide export system protein LptA